MRPARAIALVLVVAAVAAIVAVDPAGWRDPTPKSAYSDGGTLSRSLAATPSTCLSSDRVARAKVKRVRGTIPTFRVNAVPDGQTYDLRGAKVVGYPTVNRYPLMMGKYGPGRGTCVVGGTVAGGQPRSLDWHEMKGRVDGDGLHIKARGGMVSGTRIDNVEDGIATTGQDPSGISISNVYMTYIRDDCIENDSIVNVTVRDSLLDGCFTGTSQRPGRDASPKPAPPQERFTLDGVLIRLQPMPYNRAKAQCPRNVINGLGNNAFFKWSDYANRLVVRNTILLAERSSVNCSDAMRFPSNAVYQNVTLVWRGAGAYPAGLPRGVAVTRDVEIWEKARLDWLSRHGFRTSSSR